MCCNVRNLCYPLTFTWVCVCEFVFLTFWKVHSWIRLTGVMLLLDTQMSYLLHTPVYCRSFGIILSHNAALLIQFEGHFLINTHFHLYCVRVSITLKHASQPTPTLFSVKYKREGNNLTEDVYFTARCFISPNMSICYWNAWLTIKKAKSSWGDMTANSVILFLKDSALCKAPVNSPALYPKVFIFTQTFSYKLI